MATRAAARASLNVTSRLNLPPLRNSSGGGAEGGAVGDPEADACQNLMLLASRLLVWGSQGRQQHFVSKTSVLYWEATT